jgi:iron complex transport system ATP-binding protein
VLELRSVSFAYRRSGFAIRELSTSFSDGQFVSIAGPNGSGKTTLLRLLAHAVSPTSGEIVLQGKPLREWDPRGYAQHVGYLPQETEVSLPMRAIDVVVSGRAPFLRRFEWESPEDYARAEEALRTCDAFHLADTWLDEMSGGERKRVFLARVLAGSPALVLLDEPFAALDLNHIQQLVGLLRNFVSETGGTVIIVSHDLNWGGAFSDRMVVLNAGTIVADGPPAEVLRPEILERYFQFHSQTVDVPGSGRRWIVPRV